MTDKSPQLTENDHASMTDFLSHLFDGFQSGSITKETCTGVIAQIIGAVDSGNVQEARKHFREGKSQTKLLKFARAKAATAVARDAIVNNG